MKGSEKGGGCVRVRGGDFEDESIGEGGGGEEGVVIEARGWKGRALGGMGRGWGGTGSVR